MKQECLYSCERKVHDGRPAQQDFQGLDPGLGLTDLASLISQTPMPGSGFWLYSLFQSGIHYA